jgi:SNF2 family DNA or RNA helicase
MNHLLEQLKLKPKIETFQKVQVMIPGKNINKESRTIIVDERDKGYDREALMKRMMERKLSKVSVQRNIIPQGETEPREEIEEKEPTKQKQPIQRKKKLVLIDEEEQPEEQITKREVEKEDTKIQEEEEPIKIIAETSKRKTERVEKGTAILGPEILVEIGNTKIEDRLAKKSPPVIIKVSSYYMNNREFFINFINSLFEPYRREVLDTTKNISCDNIGQDAEDTMNQLLIHQKVVRDYINLYTPYRGILLYHGLGSGKTASSIAIAEGMKERKRIIVMTPASLRRNYMEEIKKFGDQIYKKNQFWEWVSLETYPEALKTLTTVLNLSAEYIRRQKGAWFVNVKKQANYNDLTSEQKKSLEDQLDEMIRGKYTFINYNGLRLKRLEELTQGFTRNLFDNCVVIIDEAHNLISRIVNKIKKEKSIVEDNRGEKERAPKNLAVKLYEYLMSAKDARIILLSGTPIINYPNEFGILFNILRGYIKTWEIPLQIKTTRKIDREALRDMLVAEKSMDYIDYSPSSKILTITRNPFGFKDKYSKDGNDYQGVYNNVKDENGLVRFHMETDFLNDDEFERRISGILKRNEIEVLKTGIKIRNRKALPDDFDAFKSRYINSQTNELINADALKRRILGLSSYFKSAQEGLLPRFDKVLGKDYHVVKIPMSDFQFKIYEDARREERKMEKPGKTSKKDDLYEDKISTYRIFSRLFCNFVIKNRPLPNDEKIGEGQAEEEAQEKIFNQDLEEIQLLKQQEKKAEKVDKLAEKQRKQEEKEKKEREKQQEKDRKQKEKEEKQQEKEKKQKEKEEKKAEKERKQKEKNEKKVGGAFDNGEQEEEEQDEVEKEEEQDEVEKEEEQDELEKEEEQEKKRSVFFNLDKILKNANKIQSQEDDLDNENEGEIEGDVILNELGGKDYEERQRSFLKYIKDHANEFLTPEALQRHSPKYLTILENLSDPEYEGLHLVYSQFRTLEGLGIFSLVLEQNGFAEFKLKKNTSGIWDIDIKFEDLGKPTFALYTGTETAEEKEMIRNIYNGDWDYVPTNITKKLRNIANNNNVGEIIKVLMITSSGSEGINLKNTRYVHIMEPYWHPVRSEQVIGRARRICSHKNLPDKLQTVEVFVYLMTFTATQLKSDEAIELKRKDTSKISNVPLTSDEYLYEISEIKAKLNAQLINSIKESAFDCYLYSNIPGSKGTGVQCVNFGDPSKEKFSYIPNFEDQQNDITLRTNKRRIEWEGFPIRIGDKDYVYRRMNKNLMNIYDLVSYEEALRVEGVQPVQVGTLETNEKGQKVFKSLVL